MIPFPLLRDVFRGVAVDEGELWAGLQDDGADEEVVDRGVGASVFAERELHEGAFCEGGAEEREEAFAGGGLRQAVMAAQDGAERNGFLRVAVAMRSQ
ncbi:hypothetical protein CMV30_00750 [Nibricoccus aquaticus]|uniref:Uncharacterized protein n=1 Tax=Nibricoccus aquaticus TaxID=2576891 RepID=A0A290Q1U5_9BACT|nr:hypothetical protein [Nibricoccus aquaticus]ATC62615.1 hypothetical protein CMV30_00750 [Nibricoccus aquaticus]